MSGNSFGTLFCVTSFGESHGPAYGAQKAGTDKMSSDMAVDLRPFGVASVSIWMGLLKTARSAAWSAPTERSLGPLTAVA